MKKRLAALLLVICMIAAYIPAGAAALPSSLTEIGNEAFRGDSSMTGLLILPGDVGRVGDHVFTGTGLYALRVPEAVTYVGAQDFRNAAYVRMDGAATQVGGAFRRAVRAGTLRKPGPDGGSWRGCGRAG